MAGLEGAVIRTSDRAVARAVLAWSGLVAVAAAGLAWLTTAVEGARRGLAHALWDGLLAAPTLVVGLAPLLVALGAALAAVRAASRGERVALELCGLGPWRTARAAAAAGLGVGLLTWFGAGHVVPTAEAARAPESSGWIWHDGLAVRLPDGLAVHALDGRIDAPHRLPVANLDDPTLARAAMLRQPRTASAEALAGATLVPAIVERQSRVARILACAALAFLTWLPLAPRPATWLARAMALGLAWQGLDLVLQSAASRGQVPLALGAWGALGGLGVVLGARYAFSSSSST